MPTSGQGDSEAYRRFAAGRVDLVEGLCGGKNEIARLRFDRAVFTSLDDPIDLAFEDDPPFVVIVAVSVINLTRILADDGAANVVCDNDRTPPRRWSHLSLDFFEADAVEGFIKNWGIQWQSTTPTDSANQMGAW
jgi:hypothetical protein